MSEAAALATLREQRYARLALAAAAHRGLTIAVAPFSRELASMQDWATWVATAGRSPQQCRTIHLTLPEAEHRRRLRERGAERDAERIAVGSVPSTIRHDPTIWVLPLDASKPVAELTTAALTGLQG